MRIFNIGFIVLFMLMVTLPLVFVDLSKDRVSVQENRMLADRPPLANIRNHPGYFIYQFDKWFKDSTGFREQMLAVYNIADKNIWLNGVRYIDGQYTYLIGRKGHRYFADVNGRIIPKFQGKQFVSDEQLQNMAVKLEEVKKYLDSKNIPLVVMFCTDKESLYPEFYPKSIKQGPEPIQIDVITTYLQEHTSVDVFNIKQALLAEKDNYLLYTVSSGDLTHYTQIGAYFAYKELMKHINVHFPQIVPFELNDLEVSYDENGSSIVSLKEPTYKKLDASFFDGFVLDSNFQAFNAVFENAEPNPPVILLLRDSYAHEGFFVQYIAQHFGKTIMTHFMNMEQFEEFIVKLNPDIVIFEAVERYLDVFADAVARIPELP